MEVALNVAEMVTYIQNNDWAKRRAGDSNTSHLVLRTWFSVFTMATGLTSFSISHLLFLWATVLQ